jgi:hypothetical protein
MTFPAGSTNLLSLPAEVLLIILGDLHDIHHFPGTAFRSICGLLAISAVNRRLRLLCLPTLFKTTRCSNAERLRQLTAECTVNPQFASLIKFVHINAFNNGSSDITLDSWMLSRLTRVTFFQNFCLL